jgi:hypothetical protein
VKTTSSPDEKTTSQARLAASRENVKDACWTKNTERTRFNALKHGLTARVAWLGQDPARSEKFFDYAWACLGPRNALEEIRVADLLRTREKEDSFLDVERTVLTRQPISQTSAAGRPFTFLNDPGALSTVNQLTRQVAHVNRVSEKQFSALLAARKEAASFSSSGEALGAKQPKSATAGMPESGSAPGINRGSLEDCLADRRLVLPGEDVEAYQSLARGLWSVFRPANLLEGFVVVDLIQAQWRVDRVLTIQRVLFERSAISASGHDCGFGFGFIQDAQRCQALDALHHYEAVLRKRLEKRMALWRKLRKEGWTDALPAKPEPPAEEARGAASEPPAPSPAAVPISPLSRPEPGPAAASPAAVRPNDSPTDW